MASLNLSSSVASSSSPSPSSSAARSMLRAPALSLSSSKHSVFSPRSFPGFHRRASYPRIYALSSNDIKVGTSLVVDGAPWRVLEFLHVKPGKGAAFVRTKMRNYITGNSVEKTFRAGSSIDEADVFKETKQFTYKDGAQFVFMDLVCFFVHLVSIYCTFLNQLSLLKHHLLHHSRKVFFCSCLCESIII
ncbi:hypothetical protein EUGRSUZ_A00739 [Eucalyptus grandis]|uniref:Uncharacterized protein n=2 Tax=Eucalyptus grandis TaxID=71139 RepID=A0ACC3M1J1_EUCGR|nr:hypothetical protein EUGRSUZ_A00739 [Eucalyptus grandis]